jgi:hypothetical protein
MILRNERLLATVSSHLNGENPNPAALSITITQSSLLGVFAQSSLLGHEQLSYGPARALAYDRRRGFRAWVDRDDRHGGNF